MRSLLALSSLGALALALALDSAPAATQVAEHPSTASRVLATYLPAPESRDAAARVAAARALLAGLRPERRAELALALDHPERAKWTNVPPRADEDGLRLGDCDEAELRLACDLLATVLGERGYARMRDILLADDRLLRGGRPRTGFGAENFWLVLFGEPAEDGTWGLQLDGHHLALNLSFHGERMTMSPSFFGAQPARFRRGKDVVEPLAGPVAAAFALVAALDDEQRAAAIVGPKRAGNVAAAGRDGFVPEREGLACAALDEGQRALALELAASLAADLPAEDARELRATLAAEIADMHFSWRGPTAPGSDASFRLQGPHLILEYACQDLGGDPLDHLHLMYRDPTSEYGAGLGG